MGWSDCLQCVTLQLQSTGSPDTSKNRVETVSSSSEPSRETRGYGQTATHAQKHKPLHPGNSTYPLADVKRMLSGKTWLSGSSSQAVELRSSLCLNCPEREAFCCNSMQAIFKFYLFPQRYQSCIHWGFLRYYQSTVHLPKN